MKVEKLVKDEQMEDDMATLADNLAVISESNVEMTVAALSEEEKEVLFRIYINRSRKCHEND